MPDSTSLDMNLPEALWGWLTLAEAAERLSIHPGSLRRLIKNRRFKGAIRSHRRFLIHVDAVDAFKAQGYDPRPGIKPVRRLL